jgi:surface protein
MDDYRQTLIKIFSKYFYISRNMQTTLKLKNSKTVIIPDVSHAKLYGKPMKLSVSAVPLVGQVRTVTLPLNYYQNVIVDWGDASNNAVAVFGQGAMINTPVTHNYANDLPYDIRIYVFDIPKRKDQVSSKGRIPKFGFDNVYPGVTAITAVDLGKLRCLAYYRAFEGAINLVTVTGQIESSVISLYDMFYNCPKLDCDLSKWDVSRIRNMEGLFYLCAAFNSSLSKWDVSNVETMYFMFEGCSIFNKSLKNWDVSKVQDMSEMFYGCTAFNQDLSKWDVSNVKNMYEMFYECVAFNGKIGNWDVSNVYNMEYMFNGCTAFDQDISKWDISRVGADDYNYPGDNEGFMYDLLAGTAFSVKNANKLVKAWAKLPVQNKVVLNIGVLPDSAHQKYVDHLVQFHGWDISA